jgi:hypothetical protein
MKKILALVITSFVPTFLHAQSLGEISNVNSLANRLAGIGNIVTYLLVGLAVIYIIWNVVHYFIRPSGSDKGEAGMNILWGIIGLFIIVSLWGIVNILVNTFYTDPNVPRNRFPNADFVNRNTTSNSGSNTSFNQDPSDTNQSIGDEPYGNIDQTYKWNVTDLPKDQPFIKQNNLSQ